MRAAVVLLCGVALSAPVTAQTTIRRVQPKAFPFAVTPSAGFGFGAVRATYYDEAACASPENCYGYGTGSGWQAGVDVQVPLGRLLGFEIGGQAGRPSLKQCLRGQCTTVDRTWVFRGTGTLLFRLKARAPVYFGVGGAVAYFQDGPIIVYQTGTAVTEYGATAVIGIDFPIDERLGGRVVWRGYFLAPSDKNVPETSALSSVAWDNALTFGVRFQP